MRIYLSGPITGVDRYRENFKEAKQMLEWKGYDDIVNPAELCRVFSIERTGYEEIMGVCIDLLAKSDCLVLLPGWEQSIGANREIGYAMAADKLIVELKDMIENEE